MASIEFSGASTAGSLTVTLTDDASLIEVIRAMRAGIAAGKTGLWLDVSGKTGTVVWLPFGVPLRAHFDGNVPRGLLDDLAVD